MKGFDLPSFLTGALIGSFVALAVIHGVAPAAGANSGAEAALFRACAEFERDAGDTEAEELFREAARALGGTELLPDDYTVTSSHCLALRSTAELYLSRRKETE